jgi:TonB family protein
VDRAFAIVQGGEKASVEDTVSGRRTSSDSALGHEQLRTPPPDASAPLATREIGVKLAEASLRRSATASPMPIYPPASLEKKVGGVAVTAILVGFSGRVEKVDILETPDAAIAAAVRDAVLRWTFRPATVGTSPDTWKIQGKLTFYFQVTDGKGRVMNPDEMAAAVKPKGNSQAPVNGSVPEIDEMEYARLARGGQSVLLDIRDREFFNSGHRSGSVNIPSDEFEIRGPKELSRSQQIVIDCSRKEIQICRRAADLLSRQGFPRVYILIHD